jgi:hypothetical protein
MPESSGSWQKLHSHAYTCAMVCSFGTFATHYFTFNLGSKNK